jgi:outer membrane lipoprotein-sorting protein
MKLKLLLFFVLAAFIQASAQSSAKILKQAEKAMGGAKLLQNTSSRQMVGRIKRLKDGATGKFLMQASRPNLYNLAFDIDGFEVESGYNGKSGWTRDSRDGMRTLTGNASVDFQAEAGFRSSFWLAARREKSKIVSGGKADVNGKPANVVVLNTAKGSSIKLFFDATTNLLVREEFSSGETTRTFEYGDFRNDNGLMQPYRMTLNIGGDTYEVVLDDVKLNPQIARTDFDFPNMSGGKMPDIQTLLKEVQENEDKVETILDTYSFVQKRTSRDLGKDGILREKESETFQLSFYKGNRISRLIEKNGKPLSEKDQRDADEDAQKQVEEIEKRIAKSEAKNTPTDESSERNRRISIGELLRASRLSNPRRERFRDRDVIVFDFEPNPNFDYKNAKSMLKFFGKTAGVMWIDEKDKQVARLEAFLADSYNIGGGVVAKLKKGASFTLEQERVNDEIWLPSTADINLSVRLFLVKGMDLNQAIRSYDYRRFTTEVKDAKIDEVKQP